MDNKGQAYVGIIGAIAGAGVGGVISYYVAWVLLNTLFTYTNGTGNIFVAIPAVWTLVLVLIPIAVAAIIGAMIIRVFG